MGEARMTVADWGGRPHPVTPSPRPLPTGGRGGMTDAARVNLNGGCHAEA